MYSKYGNEISGLHRLIRQSSGTTYVDVDDFRPARSRFTLTEDACMCNSFAFFDQYNAAMAHLSARSQISDFLKGYTGGVFVGNRRRVLRLKDVFPRLDAVVAVNFYDKDNHAWWPEIINDLFTDAGIGSIRHVPFVNISSNGRDTKNNTRSVAIDIERKLIYTFFNSSTAALVFSFQQFYSKSTKTL